MRSIEQMYAEGDFDAIRQLLDETEAKAEAKAKEERAKKMAAARETMMAAVKDYCAVAGLEISEEAIDRYLMTLVGMGQVLGKRGLSFGANSFKLPEGQTFTREHSKPIVISTAELFGEDDNILKRFLEREV